MLLLLRPDHLSVDGDETWNTRFVRVAIPSGGAEHITASEALVEVALTRILRAAPFIAPSPASLKGSCGNLACLFAFDKIVTQLDAVAASGFRPQYPRPNVKTLNALRHEAYRTAEELAFNLTVDMPRPKHGGEADGVEPGKVQKVATGVQVADHGVLALTVAAGVSNRGGTRGGGRWSTLMTKGQRTPRLRVHPSMRLTAMSSVRGRSRARRRRRLTWSRPRQQAGPRHPARASGILRSTWPPVLEARARAWCRALEKEARAIAQERAALIDTRNHEALVLGRVDARLGQLQGVVAHSMETAQKKLTDEVARKIDNMSTAVSATAERAITTSRVMNALHTLISLVGGSPPPRTDIEEPAATKNAEPGDAEHGKRAASAKAENQRGPKRQRGPLAAAAVRNPSVQDLLKQKWGAASRGAAQPTQPGSSSRSIPPGEAALKLSGPAGATATMTATVGKGKGKSEDGEGPATAGSLAARREVQPATSAAAEGKQTALAPAHAAAGHQGRSAIASAGPSVAAVEVKTEKRGRGGKKLPPTPVYTIDEDNADDELEGLVSRWVVEAGDGGEQGGEAAVEVHSGRESADEQDGDPVVVPGGTTGGHGDTGPKRRGCGIRAPPRGGPGLVSEPHLGGKKRWLGHGDRQDLQYKTAIVMLPCDGKVDPGLNLSQKQLRDWAADLSIAERLHTGLLITMHYRNLVASKDSAVRKRNHREQQDEEDEPQVVAEPKVVAGAIVSGVVNKVVAKSRDLRRIELAARETVDVIITWCDCLVAGKVIESLGLYLALPKDRLSAKKRT
ncbi:unnamed protein product [Closterium sp. Naga37s-1]|nr:unnamed protein product [Closterium sp. Naga37s-1]